MGYGLSKRGADVSSPFCISGLTGDASIQELRLDTNEFEGGEGMKANGVVRRLAPSPPGFEVGKHSVCCAHGARGDGV